MDLEVGDLLPLLVCADIKAEHDFLVEVLGFTSGGLERSDDGTVVHGEVRAGTHRIWLHPVTEGDDLLPPARQGPSGGLVIQVADVDRHYERLSATGGIIVYQPRDQPYGQREYGGRDPERYLWGAAHPV